jgi:hypothetical protein
MPGQRFVLKAATIAVMEAPDQRIAIQVPAGAEIMILDLIPADGRPDRARVEWDAKSVLMFLVDIQERGEPVPASKGKSVSRD